jgi:heptosyltransferase-3
MILTCLVQNNRYFAREHTKIKTKALCMSIISFSDFRIKAFKIPSPLARMRLKAMLKSMPQTIWRILFLYYKAQRQGKKLHFILHSYGLGDIVAGEPVVRKLISKDHFLVWIVCGQFADILRHIPWLNATLKITCCTEWLLLWTIFPWLKVTILGPDRRPCMWFNLPVKNPNNFGITLENYYDHGSLLHVFSACAIGRRLDERPKLYLDPNQSLETVLAQLGLTLGTHYIVFHCASSEELRSWSPKYFLVVLEWILRETSLHIIEFGLSPVLKRHPRVSQPMATLSLDHQATIMSGTRLFVGVDSGFAHIANACDVPAVIIMGRYRHWTNYMPFSGPWAQGDGCSIIRTLGTLDDLAPEKVIVAIEQELFKLDQVTNI